MQKFYPCTNKGRDKKERTMAVTSILAPITDLQNQIEAIKASIKQAISAFPDNPRIKRLDERCFVINSGDLGNNWSVQHHDFRTQYERIMTEIDKLPIANIPTFFKRVVEDGKIRESDCYCFTFHDDVRRHLSELLGYPQDVQHVL